MNSLPNAAVLRRDSRIRTQCRRGELARSSPPRGLEPGFLRRLAEFDPNLELYWHPLEKKWLLYTVQKATCPSEDLMTHEYTFRDSDRWPGDWIINKLREWDKFKGGAVDAKQAKRSYVKSLDDNYNDFWGAKDKAFDELSDNFARDCFFMARGRKSRIKNGDL